MVIQDIATVHFSPEQPVLFDTNVWLSVYPATSNATGEHFARAYSDFLQKLTHWRVPIVSNVIVVGEYINRCSHIEYEVYRKNVEAVSYKEYRASDDFKYVAADIAANVEEILATPGLDFRWPGGAEVEVASLLKDFSQGQVDFNDSLLARLCVKKGWPLVTNDGDFQAGIDELEIWTALPRLLKKAKQGQ